MNNEVEQVSLFDLDTWSGKMSPEPSVPIKEKTSQQSSKKQSKLPSRKLPMCLCLKKDGLQADASTMNWETGLLLGEYSMHSFGESPKDAVESHLSQILEVNPHQRYCLSAKACQGIMTRASRRGKQLPEMLRIALEQSGYYEADTARTLDALNCGYPGCNQGGMAVVEAKAYEMQAFGQYKDSGIASSLKERDYKDATDLVVSPDENPIVIDRAFFNQGKNAQYDPQYYEDGTVPTLVAKGPSAVAVRYIVRRLTPLERERLQGFPDGWTDIGEWVDSKGKKHKEADSPRYKALGNSIALPPWKWVLKRLCACYERDATMASLFDGIGGFPLIWEQMNGKGSCLWASEIEEFPMAVTKLRFGEE